MTEAEFAELVTDFVAAARMMRAGVAEAAMLRLCPLGLAEHELTSRIDRMIAAGAAVVIPVDRHAVGRVLAADGQPVDLLVDLVDLFARPDHDAQRVRMPSRRPVGSTRCGKRRWDL